MTLDQDPTAAAALWNVVTRVATRIDCPAVTCTAVGL
jgi:hypothetical protein